MGKIKYAISRVKGIDYKNMDKVLKKIALDNNKKVSYVKWDFFKNVLRYKISYTDYLKSDFINLTKDQKLEHLTTSKYYNIVNYLNKRSYINVVNDKIIFNRLYYKYVGRDFIDLRNTDIKEFKKFIDGKKNVYAKRHNWFGGEGVEKVKIEKIIDIDKLYNDLYNKKEYLIEDEIIQHKNMNKINPYAVNNLRIITILKDDKVNILAHILRINDGTSELIDHYDMQLMVNSEGMITSPAIDDNGNKFYKHPKTNFEYKNVYVPMFKESIEMVKEAALLVPELRLIGWDIAITPKGPVFIEANNYPGYGGYQYNLLHGKSVGYLKKIKDILGNEYNNIK